MRKMFLRIGSLLALIAVALGAFASHGLREILSPESLHTFEIGVRYQFYHALAILAVDLLIHLRKRQLLLWAGWLFTAGVLLFSGSLYLLALQEEINLLPAAWLGPVTPIGGTLFIIGWAMLFFSSFQTKTTKKEN